MERWDPQPAVEFCAQSVFAKSRSEICRHSLERESQIFFLGSQVAVGSIRKALLECVVSEDNAWLKRDL